MLINVPLRRGRALLSLVALLALPRADGFPDGAKVGNCGDLVPGHPSSPQDGRAPFAVSPARARTEEGRVRVMLTSPQGVGFTGFVLVARPLNAEDGDGTNALGHFSSMPDEAMPLACGRAARSGATHNNKERKKNLEFEWEAPEDFEGPVVFNATFVQDFATFWVGVPSPTVQVVRRSASVPDGVNAAPGAAGGPGATPARTSRRPTTTTPTPFSPEPEPEAPAQQDPLYDGCGSLRSCFGAPAGCIAKRNCNAAVAVAVRGTRYEFEMKALKALYVAVGLSDDAKMGGDSVVECQTVGGKVQAFMSWNVPGIKKNQRLEDQDGISLVNGTYSDGTIYCKFTRDEVTTVEGKEFNLASRNYNLLLAAGSLLNDNGVGYHDKLASASAEQRNLADVSGFSEASKLYLRLHGAFMLAAWIGAASIGIVLARYYKQTWVGNRLCGKDQWFVWHRFFMVLVWLLTLAGFVLIFVELGSWTADTRNPHAILGVVTTVLCFVQPLGAAMRPAPSSPRRPLFNWLHWLVGNAAHILAIVTIFFAVPQSKAQLPEWMDWILVSFVAFYVFIHLILSIVGCMSERENRNRVNSFPMKDLNSSRMPITSMDRSMDAPHSSLRRCLLGLHIVVILLVTAALVIIAVFAPIEEKWKQVLESLNIS